MAKRKRGGMNIAAIESAATGMTNRELKVVGTEALKNAELQKVKLGDIGLGVQTTRDLNPEHIEKLMESIETLGLLQPVVLDSEKKLLCGGHRIAALQLLKERNETVFRDLFGDGVPARLVSFSAEKDPERALAVEVAENEKRRDYTSREVKDLADRLRSQGFKFYQGAKRKRGLLALSEIIGKSERQVRRLLSGEEEKPAMEPEVKALLGLDRALGKYLKVFSNDDDVQALVVALKEKIQIKAEL